MPSSFGEAFLLQAPFNPPDLHLFLIYVYICVFWFRRWLPRNQRLRNLKFAGRMNRNDFYVLLELQSLKGNELDLERFSWTLMFRHHIRYLRWNDLDFDKHGNVWIFLVSLMFNISLKSTTYQILSKALYIDWLT